MSWIYMFASQLYDRCSLTYVPGLLHFPPLGQWRTYFYSMCETVSHASVDKMFFVPSHCFTLFIRWLLRYKSQSSLVNLKSCQLNADVPFEPVLKGNKGNLVIYVHVRTSTMVSLTFASLRFRLLETGSEFFLPFMVIWRKSEIGGEPL